MKIIETTTPISIDNLKIYFENKETSFLIDYDNSSLKEEKFLIYLSNLELPCDIKFDKQNEDHMKLLLQYLKTKNLVSLPSLEKEALSVFLQMKDFFDFGYSKFIEENYEELNKILKLIESLCLYNFYCVESKTFKNYVEDREHKNCDELGLNFVNLIKYDDFNLLFESINQDSLFFYEDFFKEYIFKGKNLYHYWAIENNPMFLLTWGISVGLNNNDTEMKVDSPV